MEPLGRDYIGSGTPVRTQTGITLARVLELVEEEDMRVDSIFGTLSLCATYMRVVLENEGLGLGEWIEKYETDEAKRKSLRKVAPLISEAVIYDINGRLINR